MCLLNASGNGDSITSLSSCDVPPCDEILPYVPSKLPLVLLETAEIQQRVCSVANIWWISCMYLTPAYCDDWHIRLRQVCIGRVILCWDCLLFLFKERDAGLYVSYSNDGWLAKHGVCHHSFVPFLSKPQKAILSHNGWAAVVCFLLCHLLRSSIKLSQAKLKNGVHKPFKSRKSVSALMSLS